MPESFQKTDAEERAKQRSSRETAPSDFGLPSNWVRSVAAKRGAGQPQNSVREVNIRPEMQA